MFAVEVYAAVRRFVFIDGNSRREAARVFGLSRETVGETCRFSLPPGYTRKAPAAKPKLGPLLPVIDAILEADCTAPMKQRHTAKRIFERQRDEHGFVGGYTVVKDHVRVARARGRETFGPDLRMAAVGAPSYFAKNPAPKTPQDLTNHRCINLRLPTHGGLYAWEFERHGREQRVRVEGQLIFNSVTPILKAALDGFGIAFLTEGQVGDHLKSGKLVEVLSDWSPPFSGYHLYYPSKRQLTPAFTVLVEAFRYPSRFRRDLAGRA